MDFKDFVAVMKLVGSTILGIFILLSVVSGFWLAFDFPRVAWSSDVERLDRGHVGLAIEFKREKSQSLFLRVLFVEERLQREQNKPDGEQSQGYIRTLTGLRDELNREIERTEHQIKMLQDRALKYNSN